MWHFLGLPLLPSISISRSRFPHTAEKESKGRAWLDEMVYRVYLSTCKPDAKQYATATASTRLELPRPPSGSSRRRQTPRRRYPSRARRIISLHEPWNKKLWVKAAGAPMFGGVALGPGLWLLRPADCRGHLSAFLAHK